MTAVTVTDVYRTEYLVCDCILRASDPSYMIIVMGRPRGLGITSLIGHARVISSLEYFGAGIKRSRLFGDDAGIEVFAAEIPAGAQLTELAERMLSSADRQRLAKICHPRRRAHFCAGRILLRIAADEVLDPTAGPWQINALDSGGLRLTSDGLTAQASLAHSGDRVVCVVAPTGRIGVDVEQLRSRNTEWRLLAAAALHSREIERLNRIRDNNGWEAFYRLWVMKEAVAKALGIGLGIGFERLLIASDFRSVAVVGEPDSLLQSFRLAFVDCGFGAVAALAWCPHSAEIDTWLRRRGWS